MTDKRMTEADVVAELRDGMTIGIGGWGSRRKPMSIVRAILRSSLRDLTVVSYGGPDVGMLCAAGKVRKAVYGFVSLDSIPLEPHFRVARQQGAIDAVELRTVRSPYDDGEELVAVPAIALDVAVIHMNRADATGNGQYLGPDLYFDDLFCMAARRRFVSCERVVTTDALLAEGSVHTLRINRMMTDGVVEAPNGAHFTSCDPDYGRDEAFQKEYASTEWSEFKARYIDVDEAEYARRARR